MGQLDDKVAVVTGGAQGIGRAIAEGLALEGARIVIADLRGAEEAAAAFRGGVGLTVDVADEAAVQRMTDETVERCGSIDVLINNAGSTRPSRCASSSTPRASSASSARHRWSACRPRLR